MSVTMTVCRLLAASVCLLALGAGAGVPVLVSRLPDGSPGAGASGGPIGSERLRLPVGDDGSVLFLSEVAGFSLLDSADQGHSWDLYQAVPGAVPRLLSLGSADGLGDALALAGGGGLAVDLREDGFLPPQRQLLRTRPLPDSGSVRTLATGSRFYQQPALSRDGRWLVCAADDTTAPGFQDSDGLFDVYLQDMNAAAGSGLVRVTYRRARPATGYTPGDCLWPAVAATPSARVVFATTDNGLVAGDDTQGICDVYLWEAAGGTVRKLSLRPGGLPCSQPSRQPAISADGRVVVFASRDPGLVAGDTNAVEDIFALDTVSGAMTRVSVNDLGRQADADCSDPDVDAGGRFVVFRSAASGFPGARNGVPQIYVYDREEKRLECVSANGAGEGADQPCSGGTLSPSGRHVTFASAADNVAGAASGYTQVFGVDRGEAFGNHAPVALSAMVTAQAGAGQDMTAAIMLSGQDAESPAAALVYRVVRAPGAGTLTDAAGNPVQAGVTVVGTGAQPLHYACPAGAVAWDSLAFVAGDGVAWSAGPATVWIEFPSTVNAGPALVSCASVEDGESQGDAGSPTYLEDAVSVSGDGRLAAFASRSTSLTTAGQGGVFLRDLRQRRTWRLPPDMVFGTKDTRHSPQVAADGCAVAYMAGGHVYHVALAPDGEPGACVDAGNVAPQFVALSGDGRSVVFDSRLRLVAEDSDSAADVYLWRPDENRLRLLSVGPAGESTLAPCYEPCLNSDGNVVAFFSIETWGPAGDWGTPLALWTKDLRSGRLQCVVRVDSEWAAFPVLSGSGRLLAWQDGTAAVVLAWSLPGGPREILRLADCSYPALSADGRSLFFVSSRADLMPDGQQTSTPDGLLVVQAFQRDLFTGVTVMLSAAADGTPGEDMCWRGALDGTGETALFVSQAANLIPGDDNGVSDVFVAQAPAAVSAPDAFSFDLSLTAGWNLISLPIETALAAPADLLRHSGGFGSAILGPAWQWDPEARTLRPVLLLNAYHGYWVYAPEAVRLTGLAGTRPLPVLRQFDLLPGWNLVGCEGPLTLPAGLPPAWAWEGGAYRLWAEPLLPEKGYWLHSPGRQSFSPVP